MKTFTLIKRLWAPPRTMYYPPLGRQEVPLIAFAILLFFTVSFFTQLGARIDALGSIRHELLVGVVLLVICALTIAQNPPRLVREQGLLTAIGVFVLVHLIQIPMAFDPVVAKDTFMDAVVKHMMVCAFVAVLVRSPRHLVVLMAAFVFSLFWVYQEAVRGLISGSLVWRNQGIMRLHGSVPLYHHPNGLSLIACMGMPFIFYLAPVVRRQFLLFGFLAGTAVCAALCIINTGSRAGYVGIVALLPYWIMEGKSKAKRFGIVTLIAVALIPVIPDQYKGRFTSIGGEETQGRSREARLQILYDAWDMWQENPGGVGVGNFPVVRTQMFGRYQDAHNLYAQTACDLGIQGLLSLLAFFFMLYRSLNRTIGDLDRTRGIVRRALRGRTNRDRGSLAAYAYNLDLTVGVARATRMLLYFMFVNGLFAHTLYHVIWWFIAGVALAASAMTNAMSSRAVKAARYEQAEAERSEGLDDSLSRAV